MSYQLHILDFAEIEAKESILFQGGDEDRFRRIGCFAWLLRGEGENILVDTGIRDIERVNRTRKGPKAWVQEHSQTIGNNLERLRLAPRDVTTVILTHAHYDHASNLPLFENARVFITRPEYDYLRGELTAEGHLHDVIRHMRLLQGAGRLHLVDRELRLDEHVRMQWVGGHTPGSQIVMAECDLGDCLFTGDAVFLEDNIRENRPIGLTTSLRQSEEALRLCADHPGLFLTGHDLSARRHFK